MEENVIAKGDPKQCCLNFDWPKDDDENLKHEIEVIIKSNESLAEKKIKNETGQLLSKYKHGNNIMNTENSKRISHINLFLTSHKNLEVQINMSLFQTYLFIAKV